jgi:hypothetical protein
MTEAVAILEAQPKDKNLMSLMTPLFTKMEKDNWSPQTILPTEAVAEGAFISPIFLGC